MLLNYTKGKLSFFNTLINHRYFINQYHEQLKNNEISITHIFQFQKYLAKSQTNYIIIVVYENSATDVSYKFSLNLEKSTQFKTHTIVYTYVILLHIYSDSFRLYFLNVEHRKHVISKQLKHDTFTLWLFASKSACVLAAVNPFSLFFAILKVFIVIQVVSPFRRPPGDPRT